MSTGPAADDPVTFAEHGGVAFVELNRPDKLNALNPALFDHLATCLEQIERSADVRVAIVHGAGRGFAAGADIEHYVDRTHDDYVAFMRHGRSVLDGIAVATTPFIAAVHGFALGGGFELALACDLVVAADNARFGLPEANLGLLPGGGGTQRLPRLVGRYRSNELLMTGRILTAAEAHAWGLVNRLAPKGDHLAVAEALAAEITAVAPRSVSLAKWLVRDGLEAPLDVALTLEQDATSALFLTADAAEGIAAFVDKRPPEFHG